MLESVQLRLHLAVNTPWLNLQTGGDLVVGFTVAARCCCVIVAQILRVGTERFSSLTCPPQTPSNFDVSWQSTMPSATQLFLSFHTRRTPSFGWIPELPCTGDTGIVFVASHLVVSSPPLLEDVTSVSA